MMKIGKGTFDYPFFMTSVTKLLFCPVDARYFNINSFCCWFKAISSPQLVKKIKDLEKFFLDYVPLVCLFYQIMF